MHEFLQFVRRHGDIVHVQDCDFHQSLELYRFVSAMALLSCGSIYFLGGVLCFGLIKRSESSHSVASSALWAASQDACYVCRSVYVAKPARRCSFTS